MKRPKFVLYKGALIPRLFSGPKRLVPGPKPYRAKPAKLPERSIWTELVDTVVRSDSRRNRLTR